MFFRSFRFPARLASSVSWERPPSASGIPAAVQSGISSQGIASRDEYGQSDGSIVETPNGPPATAVPPASIPDAANDANVVPLLLVGVRSIARLANGSLDSELAGDVSDSANDEEVDPTSIPLHDDDAEDVEPAQVPLPIDADDLEFGESQSSIDESQTASEAAARSTAPLESSSSSHSGFVMWIMVSSARCLAHFANFADKRMTGWHLPREPSAGYRTESIVRRGPFLRGNAATCRHFRIGKTAHCYARRDQEVDFARQERVRDP